MLSLDATSMPQRSAARNPPESNTNATPAHLRAYTTEPPHLPVMIRATALAAGALAARQSAAAAPLPIVVDSFCDQACPAAATPPSCTLALVLLPPDTVSGANRLWPVACGSRRLPAAPLPSHSAVLRTAVDRLPTTLRCVRTWWAPSQDYQGGEGGPVFNYTLCMDVSRKASAMKCQQGVPCPAGPDTAHVVYTGGINYEVSWNGSCTKHTCQPRSACDPPDGIPFSFIVLDDDSRGTAVKATPHWAPLVHYGSAALALNLCVGTTTIDDIKVDHYQHVRGPGMVMNWYLNVVSTTSSRIVRNSFNHSIPGQPAGIGIRDFHLQWVSPAPAASFE
eukprot:gene7410-1325_t